MRGARTWVCLCFWLALPLGGADPQFQPSAPYHATFFYPWFPQWTDGGHQPPLNWFSNYLPDPNPCAFDPARELYSSTDDKIFYWQLRKMAEARIEVAIASWWGRTHKTDAAMRFILRDAMNRADNPYPNLRWAIYYEKESIGDPSEDELTSDLEYVRDTFASQPAYLKIDGKPVIFVYATGTDQAGMAARWAEARKRTGFYVVLKVYGGYRTDPNQPDSWHQYAPAVRIDRQSPYSWMVSPGFWLDGQNVRLPRDIDEFRRAVSEMLAAPVPWKLIQTWNEWGEGTGVEPAEQVVQSFRDRAVPDPQGAPFRNLYVDALHELLPPLERGTGATDADNRLRHAASGLAGAVSPGQLLFVASNADTILFDCQPAPILRREDGRALVVVPKALAGRSYVRVDLADDWTMAPVLPAAPALFTRDGSGSGNAAALNEDGSVNSPGNPAAPGSIVSLFATGAGVDPRPPVTVEIGGRVAEVLFAGEAENLFQVNARLPDNVAGQVPVVLKIGDAASPAGVSLSVQGPAVAQGTRACATIYQYSFSAKLT